MVPPTISILPVVGLLSWSTLPSHAFVSRHVSNSPLPLSRLNDQTSSLFSAVNGATAGPIDEEESATSTKNKSTTTTLAPNVQQLLDDIRRDFDRLAELRPPSPEADDSVPKAIVSAGSSYTRIWTQETWNKHSRPPHIRYLRHISRWHASSTARVILPAVLMATAWATFLSIVCQRHQGLLASLGKLGSNALLGKLAAPLALLLTLRANASMTRLLEARQQWGRMLLHSRSLAYMIKIYVFDLNPRAAALAIRHLGALSWTLKTMLRGEDKSKDELTLATLLGKDSKDYQWAVAQRKIPAALCSRIRQLCSHALMTSDSFHSSTHLLIEERIRDLEVVIGACNRLYTSPIPPTYSRHLSRVVFLWFLFTPISLIASGLPTFGVALATTVSAYVLIGIDEVGVEIEGAFPLLPLQQVCGATQTDVKEVFVSQMPRCEEDL